MHPDGSFSPFGRTDGSGSVWLTALVAATLPAVGQYITVDPILADRALSWLADGQERDGAFKERGAVTHRMQANPVSLTAYTVLAYLEHRRNLSAPMRNSMNRGLDYLANHWAELDDPYDLAVVTYALHRAVHPAREPAWARLESQARTNTSKAVVAAAGGSLKWWERDMPPDWEKNPWNKTPNALNIEATAYALLCLTERQGITDAVPVANWLFSQQSAGGAFASTSDTYTALRALTQFSIGLSIQVRSCCTHSRDISLRLE